LGRARDGSDGRDRCHLWHRHLIGTGTPCLDNSVSFSASAAVKLVRVRELILLLGRHPHLTVQVPNEFELVVNRRSDELIKTRYVAMHESGSGPTRTKCGLPANGVSGDPCDLACRRPSVTSTSINGSLKPAGRATRSDPGADRACQ
jgi:hypothetical protein